ncbi:hypothetical protein BH23GEM9_BH23GEM9_12880 [soil metagenome]
MLALFGELDPMVPPEPNVTLLCTGFARGGNADVTLHIFPKANHDFLEARSGLWDEYHELGREYVPGFLDIITDWLGARVHNTNVRATVEPNASCGEPLAAGSGADVPARGRHTVLPRPVVFHTEETRWAAGAMVLHTYMPAASSMRSRPTTSSLSLFGTQSGHVDAHVAVDHYGGGRRLTVGLSHAVYPSVFHGIGRDLPLDAGEAYTARTSTLNVAVRQRVAAQLSVGGDIGLSRFRVSDAAPDGLLRGGPVTGSAGGTVRSVAATITLDSRDHVNATRRGVYGDARLGRADPLLGSDYAYTSLAMDARLFAAARRHVTAVQAVFTTASGGVPFQLLPRLGGETLLRGVDSRRHRDGTLAAVQAEYRTPLVGRAGAVAFAGAGAVAPDVRGLASGAPVVSAGAGLRYVLRAQERLHLRADYAISGGAGRLHVGIGEAF